MKNRLTFFFNQQTLNNLYIIQTHIFQTCFGWQLILAITLARSHLKIAISARSSQHIELTDRKYLYHSKYISTMYLFISNASFNTVHPYWELLTTA